jgi:HSP20 family protein
MNFIARREPRNAFPNLVSRMFNDPFFSGDFMNGSALAELEETALALDISEDEKNLIVRASLPGFRKEDVDVEVHDGVLTIRATHTEQAQATTETYLRKERRTRSAQRRVALPTTVEGSAVDAELKDGVLTLRLAKTPEAQPKKIAIR